MAALKSAKIVSVSTPIRWHKYNILNNTIPYNWNFCLSNACHFFYSCNSSILFACIINHRKIVRLQFLIQFFSYLFSYRNNSPTVVKRYFLLLLPFACSVVCVRQSILFKKVMNSIGNLLMLFFALICSLW